MSKKGETVSAECAATGHPKPNITWTRKNNMLLPNGKRIGVLCAQTIDGNNQITCDACCRFVGVRAGETTMLSNTLTIDVMDPNKGGIYICTANNGVGMPVSAVVEIQVMCK